MEEIQIRQNKIGGDVDWTTRADVVMPIWPENHDGVWAGPTLYTDIPKIQAI